MPPEEATITFEAQRPLMLRLAYRMLGSHAEAEDAVQEGWLRWQRADHAAIHQPAAWLTRVITRICLDQLKAARRRREVYPGPWLPEPLLEEAGDEMRPDNLTLSLMMALERLSPLERAAFLLHDVFGQPLDEVARAIDRAPATARQLAVRARAHVQIDRPRYTVPRETGEMLARAFFTACKTGDIGTLSTLLAEGATLHADGGGKVYNVLKVIHGADKVLRLLSGLARKRGAQMDYLRFVMIDGLPGFIWRVDDEIQTTAFDMEEGRVTAIYIMRNPEKLTRLRLN